MQSFCNRYRCRFVSELCDDVLCTDVGGEKDQCVGEVADTAEPVVELALVENLEEEVEDALVGLFDLVEEDDAVGLLADLVDEEAAFFVAYVSRRRAVEERHGVFFLELGHVETQEGGLFAEEEFGEGLRELGLAGTGRSEEEEGAHRLAFFVEARTGFEHGVEHFFDRVVLAHDPLLEDLLAAEKALALFSLDLSERNAGLLGDDSAEVGSQELLVVELFGAEVVVDLDVGHRAVYEVDGRCGKRLFGQVALGELDGILHHGFVDLDAVVLLVGRHDALEDLHRLVRRRLVDGYLFEVRDHLLVGLDVFGVAVYAGSRYKLEPALAELALEDGGSAVEGALLVEELVYAFDDENGVGKLLDLCYDALEAVLDLALVLGVAAEGGDVKLPGGRVGEEARDLAGGDLTDESVDEGGLADAGLSGNEEIRFGLTAENLVDDADLLFEADDIVEVPGAGEGCLVGAVFRKEALAGRWRTLPEFVSAHIGGFD